MTVFRSLFLAGLALFFAAQQALCACDVPQAPAQAAMEMAHSMPAGHACDEMQAPDHDKSACPHCGTESQLLAQMAQSAPVATLPIATTALPVRPVERLHISALPARPPGQAAYQAAGPPRRTPLQLKTRFLN